MATICWFKEDEYELRANSFFQVMRTHPRHLGSFSTDPGYWCETDTEIDWKDRANASGGNLDWWDSEWVRAAWQAGLGPESEF